MTKSARLSKAQKKKNAKKDKKARDAEEEDRQELVRQARANGVHLRRFDVEFKDNEWGAATFWSDNAPGRDREVRFDELRPNQFEDSKGKRELFPEKLRTRVPNRRGFLEQREPGFGEEPRQYPEESDFRPAFVRSPPNPKEAYHSPPTVKEEYTVTSRPVPKNLLPGPDPFIHPSRLALLHQPPPKALKPTTDIDGDTKMSPSIAFPPRRENPFRTNLRDTPPRNPHGMNNNRKVSAAPAPPAEEEIPPLVDAAAPDRSKIVVARQFIFQHECEAVGLNVERDVVGRLTGIGIIEGVRRALRMPIKTFGTACVFYLRYRYHIATSDEKDPKYDFRDAALACLWLASKAEETPKKSKEILCAARNLTVPIEDHLTPDDESFETPSKVMITLERKLLEIVAFDFRARNSADVLAGLAHETGVQKSTGIAALAICLDVHRTLAVLKQTRQTLALACLELAARFYERDAEIETLMSEALYERVGTSRNEVAETIRDLIELYMSHQSLTVSGPRHTLNDFMRVSISLTTEMKEKNLPRYSYYRTIAPFTHNNNTTSPISPSISTPTIQHTPRTPAMNGADSGFASLEKHAPKEKIDFGNPVSPPPPMFLQASGYNSYDNGNGASMATSPTSPTTTSPSQPLAPPNPDDPSQISSIVRFVLDASRAHEEKVEIAPYYNIVTEEIVEEREIYIPIRKPSALFNNNNHSNNGNHTSNHTSRASDTRPPPSRIHGGFLSRGDPHRERERERERDRERERERDDAPPRRTFTPPPHHRGAGRGGGGSGRDRSPRRHSPPSGRGGYRGSGGGGADRRDNSPPPRREGGGYRGHDRRGDDRREGRREYR